MAKIQTESLPVKLTETELREFGQRSARTVKEVLELKDKKKAVNSEFSELIKEKEANIRELSHCVNSGVEFRDVEVKHQFDRPNSEVIVVRTDTGEVVRTRPMTPEEQQGILDLMMGDE